MDCWTLQKLFQRVHLFSWTLSYLKFSKRWDNLPFTIGKQYCHNILLLSPTWSHFLKQPPHGGVSRSWLVFVSTWQCTTWHMTKRAVTRVTRLPTSMWPQYIWVLFVIHKCCVSTLISTLVCECMYYAPKEQKRKCYQHTATLSQKTSIFHLKV